METWRRSQIIFITSLEGLPCIRDGVRKSSGAWHRSREATKSASYLSILWVPGIHQSSGWMWEKKENQQHLEGTVLLWPLAILQPVITFLHFQFTGRKRCGGFILPKKMKQFKTKF
ncbi:hypothetical protein NPIL_216371 [Nephila pilipes]|uniref:Uncharacterized protein n=1 Tax=Nephila pilipes TaxID=299642 RepID=A0A8X6INZ8_NEPPI|nr:hypothetical protein NPIL_216371 [Nephila pilipes]